jgi:hypothetical protein
MWKDGVQKGFCENKIKIEYQKQKNCRATIVMRSGIIRETIQTRCQIHPLLKQDCMLHQQIVGDIATLESYSFFLKRTIESYNDATKLWYMYSRILKSNIQSQTSCHFI